MYLYIYAIEAKGNKKEKHSKLFYKSHRGINVDSGINVNQTPIHKTCANTVDTVYALVSCPSALISINSSMRKFTYCE
jgi:hypothetical protein